MITLTCTEDAMAFGARASSEELKLLAAEKARFDALVDREFKEGRLQKALNFACASQLRREAIEAAAHHGKHYL